MEAKPFLKCAGGKRQILSEIVKRLPEPILKSKFIERYTEPFVGGGALFFHLKQHFKIKSALLLDINEDFVLAYRVVQKNVRQLITELRKMESKFLKLTEADRKSYFYDIRANFNYQRESMDFNDYNPIWIKRATWLIFLNKTCFNGLYRQNQKGSFNVPFGRYKRPTICQAKNLTAVNLALRNVKIKAGDFEEATEFINDKSLVYFDPPYRPLSKTASFTAYSRLGFSDDNQVRLAQFFEKMDAKGASLILSNSDPKNQTRDDEFFDELYSKYKIERIPAVRMINSVAEKRGKIHELLIRNY